MKTKLLTILLLSIISKMLLAQVEEPLSNKHESTQETYQSVVSTTYYWISPAIGTYTPFVIKGEVPKFSMGIGATVHKNEILYRLMYMHNSESILGTLMVSPYEYYNCFSILLGKRISNSNLLQINLSGGIGVTSGLKRNELIEDQGPGYFFFPVESYTSEKFVTPSVPIELELMFKPIKYVGLGAGFFCEINFKKPLLGITGKAMLGKIK